MLDIAKHLDHSDLPVQLILLCGRNERLARSLKELDKRIPMFIEGFTTEVPYYMHLADFMIGKPGPGSISEALAMGLPLIVQRNASTLPQEKYNARWVLENEVGLGSLQLPSHRPGSGTADRTRHAGPLSRQRFSQPESSGVRDSRYPGADPRRSRLKRPA